MAQSLSRPRAVSAVVPCFNVGGYLIETVASLLDQTTPPAEILVIDDCSTDPETAAALETVAALPTCRVLRQAANGGVARSRNAGIDAASGDAVVFLDGDDMFQRDSLEAFAEALERSPDAGFAYPTVTCFGNRSDTFLAPPFDHYLLHHVNICPIAAMVRMSALESGVRFDPSIVVGHEDWDFWLRLTATGVVGTPAADAVMFYRRMGFTRMDAGNRAYEDFATTVRRLRPDLFDAERLVSVKADWAPALAVVADPIGLDRSRMSTGDVRFLTPPLTSPPNGKIVLVAPSGVNGLFAGRFSAERIIAFHETRPEVDFVACVRKEAVSSRAGFLDELVAEDVRGGFVDPADVVAISYDPLLVARDVAVGPRDEVWMRLLTPLARAAIEHPPTVVWCAGPSSPRVAQVPMPDPTTAIQELPTSDSDEWLRRARAGLHAALPWRLVTWVDPLFRGAVPSAAQVLVAVTDDRSMTTLYCIEEHPLPPGLRHAGASGIVLRNEAVLTIPLLRVIEPATGRRSIAVGTPAEGCLVERILGHAEVGPLPGTIPLASAIDGVTTTNPAWIYPHSSGVDSFAPHRRPLLGARRWWRGRDLRSGLHYYDFSPKRLARSCIVEGPVCAISTRPRKGDLVRLYALHRPDDARSSGFTATPEAPPRGHLLGQALGWLVSESSPPLRPVFVHIHRRDGDVLCSNLESEGRGVHYLTEVVGYGWC